MLSLYRTVTRVVLKPTLETVKYVFFVDRTVTRVVLKRGMSRANYATMIKIEQ